MNRRLLLTPTVAVLALTAVPAADAAAATIAATTPCTTHIPTFRYASMTDPFPTTIQVAGGTPGARFLVAVSDPKRGYDGSKGSESGTFDAAGNGSVVIPAISVPYRASDDLLSPISGRAVNLSVQDFGQGGAVIATGTTKVTNLAASLSTRNRSLRSSLPFRASGAVFAGQKLSAFLVKGTGAKVIRRYSLGTANDCGYVSTKKAFARGRSTGSYRVYVQPGTRLDESKPFAAVGFSVRRRFF
jgi:hypothetical protein